MTTDTPTLSASIESNPKPLLYGVLGLLGIALVAVLVLQNRSSKAMDAQGVLHFAAQAVEKANSPEAQKLGFADRYKDALPKLEAVVATYPNARAGFEAAMMMGNIYFEHAKWDDAKAAFQKAQKASAGDFEKAGVSVALAQVAEAQKEIPLAIELFEKASRTGAGTSMQGQALLGLARAQASSGKPDLARATYDKIIKDLADSPFSARAETLKGSL